MELLNILTSLSTIVGVVGVAITLYYTHKQVKILKSPQIQVSLTETISGIYLVIRNSGSPTYIDKIEISKNLQIAPTFSKGMKNRGIFSLRASDPISYESLFKKIDYLGTHNEESIPVILYSDITTAMNFAFEAIDAERGKIPDEFIVSVFCNKQRFDFPINIASYLISKRIIYIDGIANRLRKIEENTSSVTRKTCRGCKETQCVQSREHKKFCSINGLFNQRNLSMLDFSDYDENTPIIVYCESSQNPNRVIGFLV